MRKLLLGLILGGLAYGQQPVGISLVNGVTALAGAGAVGTGSLRVAVGQDTTTIAGSAPGTAGSASANVVTVQGVTSMTPVQVSQATASNLNAAVVGIGTAGSASGGILTVQGVASMTPLLVTATFGPSTSSANAFSMKHVSSAAAFNIKASAGNLYGLSLGNSGTNPCWLQLFNNAGTPTAGTSVIDSYFVQAGVSTVVPGNLIALENFATGIAAAGATTDGGATTTGCTTTFTVTAYYD